MIFETDENLTLSYENQPSQPAKAVSNWEGVTAAATFVTAVNKLIVPNTRSYLLGNYHGWAFAVFLHFSVIKIIFLCIFYQVNLTGGGLFK